MNSERFIGHMQEEAGTGPATTESERSSIEKRELIFERGAEERRGLLAKIFESRMADLMGNLVPGIDVAKMTAEVIRGKTSSGVELSPRDRFSYSVMALAIAASYVLMYEGDYSAQAAVRGGAASLGSITFGPKFVENAAEIARKKVPGSRLADILEKCESIFKNGYPDAAAIAQRTADWLSEKLKNLNLPAAGKEAPG